MKTWFHRLAITVTCVAVLLSLLTSPAFSFTRQLTYDNDTGLTSQVRWPTVCPDSNPGCVKLPLKLEYCCSSAYQPSRNLDTTYDGTNGDFDAAGNEALFAGIVKQSMDTWNNVITSGTLFDSTNFVSPYSRTSPLEEWDVDVTGSAIPNGHLSVLWTSAIPYGYGQDLQSNTIGLTTTWFSVSTGLIIETDVQLNDDVFGFVDDTDGTGAAAGPSSGSSSSHPWRPTRVRLSDVLTHEFGHVLGLDHSQTVTSTMMPYAADGQMSVLGDDASGVRAIYQGVSGTTGALRGTVVDSSGTFMFGAYVTAVEVTSDAGTVPAISSTLTYLNGEFYLPGLPAGLYMIFVAPFELIDNVGDYYYGHVRDGYGHATSKASNPFGKKIDTLGVKGFVPGAGGSWEPFLVQVTANSATQWLNINTSTLVAGATGNKEPEEGAGANSNDAIATAANQTARAAGDHFIGTQPASDSADYFKFSLPSGKTSFFARIVAHAVYGALDPVITVVNSSNATPAGATCTSPSSDNEVSSPSGDKLYDSYVFCTGITNSSPPLTIYVKVTSGSHSCSTLFFGSSTLSTLLCDSTQAFYAVMTGYTDGTTTDVSDVTADSVELSPPAGFVTSLTPGVSLNCSELSSAQQAALANTEICNPTKDGCSACGSIGRPMGPDDWKRMGLDGALVGIVVGIYLAIRRRRGIVP